MRDAQGKPKEGERWARSTSSEGERRSTKERDLGRCADLHEGRAEAVGDPDGEREEAQAHAAVCDGDGVE